MKKKLTPHQKGAITKEYRRTLNEVLNDLSFDEETDDCYLLSVNKEVYDAWMKAADKALRHGIHGLL